MTAAGAATLEDAPAGTAALGGRRPVVFMGLPMAINVRDVLRTDAYRTLLAAGVEVHLFTPADGVPEFRAEFARDGVHIHALPAPRSRVFELWDAAVLKLHVLLLSLRCETALIMIGPTLRRSPVARAARGLVRALGRAGQDALLRFTRAVTLRVAPELYAGAFHQYRPDLVVGTRVITMSGPRSHSSPRYLDRHLLMSAARRGVPTMVLVSSWDNLTTSGFFPVELDRMTVWNEIMREQAVAIHGLPADRVFVTGAPQHDLYATHAPFQDRACFFATLGLDPARPLVVYTTATDGTIPGEPELVATIQAALARELPNVQLLVRLHQLDRMERYRTLRAGPAITFDQAGRLPLGAYHDRDFDAAQHQRLADTLRHADVVINTASSISIAAAAVGTPVVCVDFDARPGLPYHESITRFYAFTHQRPIADSGGVARVCSVDALVAAVRRYLEDPSLDRDGRARLVREQCHALDGRAGERVGRAMLEMLARRVPAA